MRPNDLKPIFTWKNRHIVIHDRVWYVPARVPAENKPFIFPGWSHPDVFGNDQPVNVEYCSGNGDWIANKAQQHPELNWVAVEKKFDRVKKIWAKIKNRQLSNLFVICGEAYASTKTYFTDQTISEVYINFPDPWPKNKHAKHRIIQSEFVQEMWRILRPESPFTFVTDDIPYSEWFTDVMQKSSGFQSLFPEPFYTHEQPNYGSSYFEELWRSKGKIIRYHQYKRISS